MSNLKELPKLYSWVFGGESQDSIFFKVPQKVARAADLENHEVSFTSYLTFASQQGSIRTSMENNLRRNRQIHIFSKC